MAQLFTTLGPLERHQLGMILPHEHVFVDLRTPDQPGYAEAEAADVVRLMAPQIELIKKLGITALVECSTPGVGRRPDFDLAVSQATNFPIVVPTGNYREPWIPEWVKTATDEALEAFMLRELTERFEEADYKAGWIKLSAGDDGITPLEEKILRAAARAAARTNAVIGSHTIKGRVVLDQIAIIEQEGCTAERFISIHSQAEPDFGVTRSIVEAGAWIEYDNAGWVPDDEYLAPVMRALEAGYAGRMLLSHDRGWYDPSTPDRTPHPYTHLSEAILPQMREAGVDDATIKRLTHDNPFNAFAR